MSWSGIKRNLTDKLFSDIVRERANYICGRCQKDFSERKDIFDTSHFYTRGNKRVRWNFDNASALCRGCHQYFGKNPREHTEFMEKKLGRERFDLLSMQARTRGWNDSAVDEKLIRQGLKIEWVRMQKEKKPQILGSR